MKPITPLGLLSRFYDTARPHDRSNRAVISSVHRHGFAYAGSRCHAWRERSESLSPIMALLASRIDADIFQLRYDGGDFARGRWCVASCAIGA